MKPEDLERFVPDGPRARRIALEHLARYRFARSLTEGRSVLDLGCGEGYGTAMLAGTGANVCCGVDLSPAAVSRARRNYPGSGACFAASDAVKLPFADGSFDAVICFEVVEHLEQPQDLLSECRRVAGEDGLVILSTPNRLMTVEQSAFHVREYAPDELRELLEEHLPGATVVPQTSLAQSSVGGERRTGGWADEIERADYLVACWGPGLPDRVGGAGEHVRLADVERLLDQSLRHFMDLVDRVDADRSNLRQRLRHVEESLEGVDADRRGLRGAMAELEGRLRTVEADRANLRALLEEQELAHRGVAADRDNLRARLQEREELWAGVEADRENLARALAELREVHQGVEADRANLRAMVDELGRHLAEVEDERETRARCAEEQVERLRRRVAELELERDEQAARVAGAERDLDAVLSSRSWRLLRALGIAKR